MGDERLSPPQAIAGALLAGLPDDTRALADAFAALSRAARDLAEDASLPIERRQAAIAGLAAILDGRKPEVPLALPVSAAASELRAALAAADIAQDHARHVLQAWRQDCAKNAYRDWADWLLFARFAAAPVARALCESAGADPSAVTPAEALACALLLLWQLQEASEAYRATARTRLPDRWFRQHGAAAADLAGETASPALKAVYEEGLRAAAQLLSAAQPLPRALGDKSARAGAAKALALADAWARRLAQSGPFARPVRLRRADLWHAAWLAWRQG